MGEQKFTPGPWFDDEDETDDGEIWITAASRAGFVEICRVEVGFTGPIEKEQRANAHLIAAAPEMLAALRLCVARDQSLKANVMVMEALAKAEGR